MLMGKTCKMCTIPIFTILTVQNSYLLWNIHYSACSRQKLGAGAKLMDKDLDSDMSISLDPIMLAFIIFLLNIW